MTLPKGETLIKQYFNYLKPDMDYKEFSEVCRTPFLHLRRQMAADYLPEIRLMYLGVFRVHPGMIVSMLQFNQKRYEKNLIDQKQYEQYMNKLIGYINRNPELFKKHKEKLSKWKTCL